MKHPGQTIKSVAVWLTGGGSGLSTCCDNYENVKIEERSLIGKRQSRETLKVFVRFKKSLVWEAKKHIPLTWGSTETTPPC